jgi:hypothetical protein
MKKIAIAILVLSLGVLLPGAGKKFSASIGAAAFVSGDSGFKSLYGDVQFSPEIKLSYDLLPHFFIWLGAGFVSATGVVPEVGDGIKATQTFLSLGAGWETRRMGRLQADLAAALLMAGTKEKAMGVSASKSAPGFDARAGLRYFLRDNLFAGVTLGYAGAWTTVMIGDREKDIVLGGLRLGGMVGFRF